MEKYNAIKVFSATKARERSELGEEITRWIDENPGIDIKGTQVKQSSDSEFHCLSIIIFYDRAQ